MNVCSVASWCGYRALFAWESAATKKGAVLCSTPCSRPRSTAASSPAHTLPPGSTTHIQTQLVRLQRQQPPPGWLDWRVFGVIRRRSAARARTYARTPCPPRPFRGRQQQAIALPRACTVSPLSALNPTPTHTPPDHHHHAPCVSGSSTTRARPEGWAACTL